MYLYYVTRRCDTGINTYHYYSGGREIGHAEALILPDFPVSLYCADLTLRHAGKPEVTLLPGISSSIPEAVSGKDYARVFWDGMGQHRLHTPFGNFQVEYRDGTYRFCADAMCVAELCPPDAEAKVYPDTQELRLLLYSLRPLPAELAVLMLSFPLVQLGP